MEAHVGTTPQALFAERFQCLSPLKTGRGTATWLGSDVTTGDRVVIKTSSVATTDPDAALRLEHEATVLQQLGGEGLVSILAVGQLGEVTYLVTPFVSGVTLQERLASGPLSIQELLLVGRALSGTLEHAHERGVLHRDLKPSNIIVDGEPVLTRATVIDFGLARSAHLDVSVRDISVGTVRYLAPEQAGLLSRPVDERSDLYAVGVVLFECAAGRAPFDGPGVGRVLRAHLCEPPPELRSLGCNVPRALDEIIQRLLRKDPDDRYQTAVGLAADLAELSDGLARGVLGPVVVVGHADQRHTLTEPAFVGRDDELALLDAHLAHAQQGQGGMVCIEAESGGGKTRLLEEFAQRSIRAGAWVLRGQAVNQAAVRPFQLLDGVIRGVVARLETDMSFAEHLRHVLGEQREAVCEAVPQLARHLNAGTAVSLGQEAHGELRSLRALTALLDSLATERSAPVIVLDDAQWSDDLTLKLLDYRQHRAEPRGNSIATVGALILVAFRSEDVPPQHRLRRLTDTSSLILAPFSPAAIRRLAESMAGRLPDEAMNLVVQLANGSPFMATAVLQGLVEIGGLIPNAVGDRDARAPGWRIDQQVVEDIRSSNRAAVLLTRRLDRLPSPALTLLSVGAVLGKEFALDLAGELAHLAEHEAAAGCQEAVRRHLIWLQDNGSRCLFVHDKIREALLSRMSAEERQRFHGAAASKIEAEDPERIFDLAYHFDAAGQSDRALPYALQAAEHARARHTLSIAEQHYRIADRGVVANALATQIRIAEGLGDVLMLQGKYDEAEMRLETARSLVSDTRTKASVDLKLGELALKRGDVKASSRVLERGLRLLGRVVPRNGPSFLAFAAWEVGIQSLHTAFPSLLLGRRALTQEGEELLAMRLYSRLAYTYYFISQVRAMWAHLREMNLAERYPRTRELGQAYSNHIPSMELLAWFRRGARYAERSLRLRRELGDLWGEGQTSGFYGFMLLSASQFNEALDKLSNAGRVFERAGDQWERNNVAMDTAACLHRMGRLNEAITLSRRIYQVGCEIGEPKALAGSLDTWAKASGGQIPRELIAAELARNSEDVLRNAQVSVAEALRLLREKKAPESVAMLEKTWRDVVRANFRSEEVASIPAWMATALRTHAAEVPIWNLEKRLSLIKQTQRAARRALRLARRYRNNLPHALREAGLLAAMQGRPRRARTYLDQSASVAELQGAKFEYAQTLWARGQVGVALRWSEAATDLEQGRTALRAVGAYWVMGEESPQTPAGPVTPALMERFDALLKTGRRIASALTREGVWTSVQDAATMLLGAEDCLILHNGRGSPSGSSASQTLVARAIQNRRPVTASVGVSEDPSESLVLGGARSVLCAPIAVRSEIVSCLYASHRHIGGLFGPDEERLTEFIVTLAGAALENIDGVAQTENHLITNSTAGLAQAINRPAAALRSYVDALRNLSPGDVDTVNEYLRLIETELDCIGDSVRCLQNMPLSFSRTSPASGSSIDEPPIAHIRDVPPGRTT